MTAGQLDCLTRMDELSWAAGREEGEGSGFVSQALSNNSTPHGHKQKHFSHTSASLDFYQHIQMEVTSGRNNEK